MTYSQDYRAFLKRLKNARKEAGLTQKQAAKSLGKNQSFISKCESGERRVDILELKVFAKLYGKTLDYFVEISPD
jgi:transcriptional regulator with XRE-family HTH domain